MDHHQYLLSLYNAIQGSQGGADNHASTSSGSSSVYQDVTTHSNTQSFFNQNPSHFNPTIQEYQQFQPPLNVNQFTPVQSSFHGASSVQQETFFNPQMGLPVSSVYGYAESVPSHLPEVSSKQPMGIPRTQPLIGITKPPLNVPVSKQESEPKLKGIPPLKNLSEFKRDFPRAEEFQYKLAKLFHQKEEFMSDSVVYKRTPLADRIKCLNEEKCHTGLPPLETFMDIPQTDRRTQFYKTVRVGDIVVGCVSAVGEFCLTVSLLSLDSARTLMIHDLRIKAYCKAVDIPKKEEPKPKVKANEEQFRLPDAPSKGGESDKSHKLTQDQGKSGESSLMDEGSYFGGRPSLKGFHIKDNIKAVVVGFEDSVVLVSMISEDLPDQLQGHVKLGYITEDELPDHYKTTVQFGLKTYDWHLRQPEAFKNPNLSYLTRLLGVDENSSLMVKLESNNYKKEDFADDLRKKQLHRLVNNSIAEGIYFTKQGQYERAALAINKALDVEGKNLDALMARGTLYASTENYPNAIKDFEQIISLDKKHSKAKMYLCETLIVYSSSLIECDRDDDAISFLKKVLFLDPGNEEARNLMTHIAFKPKSHSKKNRKKEEFSLEEYLGMKKIEPADPKSRSKTSKSRSHNRSRSRSRSRSKYTTGERSRRERSGSSRHTRSPHHKRSRSRSRTTDRSRSRISESTEVSQKSKSVAKSSVEKSKKKKKKRSRSHDSSSPDRKKSKEIKDKNPKSLVQYDSNTDSDSVNSKKKSKKKKHKEAKQKKKKQKHHKESSLDSNGSNSQVEKSHKMIGDSTVSSTTSPKQHPETSQKNKPLSRNMSPPPKATQANRPTPDTCVQEKSKVTQERIFPEVEKALPVSLKSRSAKIMQHFTMEFEKDLDESVTESVDSDGIKDKGQEEISGSLKFTNDSEDISRRVSNILHIEQSNATNQEDAAPANLSKIDELKRKADQRVSEFKNLKSDLVPSQKITEPSIVEQIKSNTNETERQDKAVSQIPYDRIPQPSLSNKIDELRKKANQRVSEFKNIMRKQIQTEQENENLKFSNISGNQDKNKDQDNQLNEEVTKENAKDNEDTESEQKKISEEKNIHSEDNKIIRPNNEDNEEKNIHSEDNKELVLENIKVNIESKKKKVPTATLR